MPAKRRVTFITGTRAEFGLMEHALRRLRDHPKLDLSIVATGMHLSREHGYTVDSIRKSGWRVDATVPWRGSQADATGLAISGLSKAIDKIDPDVVLVVGDRVEAFAGATAGHLTGRIVAHVHGGDRALGQSDDALRHAITKLAHLHFPATTKSAQRVRRLGEDAFRVHVVGTPGLDDLPNDFPKSPDANVVIVLHPDDADEEQQARQARMLVATIERHGPGGGVVIYPNNDPGWRGIARVWDAVGANWRVERNLKREDYLRTIGSAAMLVGNSSSGIIEAASLGTRVINIGPRQAGRERSANLVDVEWKPGALAAAVAKMWNKGRPKRFLGRNVYGGGHAGQRIANVIAGTTFDHHWRKKLICY